MVNNFFCFTEFLLCNLCDLCRVCDMQVRREKISERMKYLQDLVPGCNKITGKAGMLDEIINYVQSLQRQVEVYIASPATLHSLFCFCS